MMTFLGRTQVTNKFIVNSFDTIASFFGLRLSILLTFENNKKSKIERLNTTSDK